MKFPFPSKRVDWTNSVFLLIICLLAIFVAPIYLWFYDLNPVMLGMFYFYLLVTGMSITLGYHRLFSHLSFKAKWPVRFFTVIFGACAFENSVIHWCSDHRRHHKYVDGDEDPYDISKGFFWAHMGWILFKTLPEPPLDNVADLRKDKIVMWQFKYDKIIAFTVGFLLPTLIGYLTGGVIGALGGFLVVGALRVFLVQQCTFFINSLCHTIGNRPYSSNCSARDSFVMSLVTFGEGYHNYHHEFQHDYRNGVKSWNFDPTKWAIWCLSKVGLASNLRRVPHSRVVLAEMTEARRKAENELERIATCDDCAWRESATLAVQELLESLSASYHELEQALSDRVDLSKKALSRWQKETRQCLSLLADIRAERFPALS